MPSSRPCGTRERRGPETIPANIAIYAVFLGWTLLCLPLGFALSLLCRCAPGRFSRLARKAIWAYGRGMLRLLHPWLPVRIDDPSTALRHAPCILVANHQSFLDIYLLGAQDQSDLCLVSKSWPHRLLFFFAPMMRSAGYIDAQSLDAATVHARCRERIADGATLVFFPEGRRSRDGNLGRFHAGAFLLALEEGVPVVPLAIMDSFRACPPGSLRFRPGGIHMAVLPPMHPPRADDPLAHRTFMRSVRTAFLQALPEGADGQGHAPHGESPDNTARPPHGNAVQSSPIP